MLHQNKHISVESKNHRYISVWKVSITEIVLLGSGAALIGTHWQFRIHTVRHGIDFALQSWICSLLGLSVKNNVVIL